MKLFRLSADESLVRIDQSGEEPKVHPLGNCLLIGGLGFCFVSILVFGIWAFAGRPLHQALGEGGFYAVLALAFMGLSGALFDRLIIGRGSMKRFYALFIGSFLIYSVLWCAAWFLLAKPVGPRTAGVVGSLVGTIPMAACFCAGFENWKPFAVNALVLFAAHTIGYFVGDLLFTWLSSEGGAAALENIVSRPTRIVLAKLSWGLGYGLGFGAGIGHNLHALQEPVRERLFAGGSGAETAPDASL